MAAALAQTTAREVIHVSTAVGVATFLVAIAAVLAIGWIGWRARPQGIRPGAATMDLRDETPALVDLLTGGFEVEDDAVPATVVDLAQRGWFTIEEAGERTIIRTRRHPTDDELTAYEQRVLRHIERHAIDGVVPTHVLTIGSDGVSDRWFRGFVREVSAHGRSLGLCVKRFGFRQVATVWALTGVAFAAPVLVGVFAQRDDDPTAWGSVGNLLVGLSFLTAMLASWLAGRVTRSDAQAETAAGRAAAEHWLGVRDHYEAVGSFGEKPAASVAIWDRHLAYATAMGLAPVVQRQIPFETEHDRHAWSRASGSWRRVKVRYFAARPNWGDHPGRVLFEGVVQTAVFGVVGYVAFYIARADTELDTLTAQQRQWVGLGGLVVAILCAAAVAVGLLRVVLGVLDLFPRRTIEGEVIRRRVYRRGHRLPKPLQWLLWSGRDEHGMRRDQRRQRKYHLAVDDGSDDSVVAYTVRSSIHGQAPQGARVRMRVSPLLGYVASVELLQAPRASAASESSVAHPLATEAAGAAGAVIVGSLDAVYDRAESLTDEDGRPMLDQTDDEGVTMRQRLEESKQQLDAVRNDPRLANSPMGGLLDAFLGSGTRDDDQR